MNLFKAKRARDEAAALAQIPVIDFGPAFAGEPGALERLAAEVRQACEGVAFLYIKNHGIDQAVIDRAFAASRRFHALPLEQKLALKINANNIGYLPVNASMQRATEVHKATRPNFNESFFVSYDRPADHPDVLAGKPFRGRNQWPDEAAVPGLRADIMAYFTAVEALGHRMLPAFARALDMPADFFAPFFADEGHAPLRFLHYPPQETDDPEQFGAGPHTDNGFLTILAREDGVPGLAVRLLNGEWVAPPVIPGTLLINLGNILKRWSNNRFQATPHGVVNETGADRYSIAFFFGPNPAARIECLPTCTGPDNPPRYDPATYLDLIFAFYNANYDHRQSGDRQKPAA